MKTGVGFYQRRRLNSMSEADPVMHHGTKIKRSHTFKRISLHTASRDLRLLNSLILFLRRVFSFLWRPQGDPKRQTRTSNPPDTGDDRRIAFAASQMLFGTNVLPSLGIDQDATPQVAATSNAVDRGAYDTEASCPHPTQGLCTKDTNFWTISPSYFEQYIRYREKQKLRIEPGNNKIRISAFSTNISENTLEGWKKHIHPQGATYFHYERKGKVDVFTDENLDDLKTRTTITSFIQSFDDYVSRDLQGNLRTSTESVELVLGLEESGELEGLCGYYLADTSKHAIFWLDDFEAKNLRIWGEVPGVTEETRAHIYHELESQYWYHSSLFPNTRKIAQELIDDLRDMLAHDYYAVSVSKSSTVEPTADQTKTMLEVIFAAEKHIGKPAPGSMFVLSQIKHLQARHRFMHFHGQPSARLFREQAIYEETPTTAQRSYPLRFLSPILFLAPEYHLGLLRKMYVDKLLYASVVKSTIETLDDEWKGLILNANVLLNASVALSGRSGAGSAVQIFGYVSVAMSTGSIIIGLLLVRQNKTKSRDNIDRALTFLRGRSDQTLAILYSLPYALLIWAMLASRFYHHHYPHFMVYHLFMGRRDRPGNSTEMVDYVENEKDTGSSLCAPNGGLTVLVSSS
ncbi:hypothetical protein AB1N83_008735 [Pleurotus pulmonarius]